MTVRPRKFGKYLLLDRIGAGGMAEIWRARQFGAAGFQKDLVIKKILPHLAANDEFVRMFIDEAKIAVALQHANIVQIFDLGAVDREYFIAMEYVVGKDLLNLLIRCTQLRIRVPQKLALFIVAEVVKGLEVAHTATDSRGAPLNIIHRDVSPSNVLVSYDGNVKLGDFGVAKARRRETESTRAGTMKGKLGYMSPEQVLGQPVDARSDLFGAGIMLFEMLSMSRLFRADTELATMMAVRDAEVEGPISKLPPSVPESLRALLRKVLARRPEDRFQTAHDLHEALADHLFETKVRVTQADMARYMRAVFAKEIEDEAARRDAVEALVEPDEILRAEAAEAGRMQGRIDTARPAPVEPPRTLTGLRPRFPTGPRATWSRESQFRIRRASGKTSDVLAFTAIIRLIEQDALEATDQISIDGGAWQPAAEVAAVLHGEAPKLSTQASPDFAGTFSQLDFPRLLYRYAITRATGRMRLWEGGRQKEIFWRTGRPEYVTSTQKHELLGEYLVAKRFLGRNQLNQALGILPDFDGRLGDALLHLKLLAAADLFAALGAHVKEKLLDLFAWSRGEYAFHGGEQTSTQIVPLEIGAWPLLNEGVVRNIPPELILKHFEAQMFLPVQRLRHRLLEPAQLDLSQRQTRIWNAVTHGVSIERQLGRLLAIPGVREAEAWQVLFLMERLDFIRLGTQ